MKADDFLDFDRNAYLAQTDRELSLPAGWSAAQIGVESNDDPSAVSPRGAMGLAQVVPKTLRTLEKRAGRKLDPFNEADALYIHREVMRENMAKFGNAEDASRAYNSGWERDKWGNDETASYVPKIKKRLGKGDASKPAGLSADAFLDAPDDQVASADVPSAADFLDAPDAPAGSVGATDYLKQFGGSVVKSAGDTLTGIGKSGELQAEDAAAQAPADKFTVAPPAADANVAKAVGRAGGWLSKQGDAILDTRSDAAKTAMENSTPEGNVLDAARNADVSGLSMGKAPSAAGFGLQATNVAGQVLPQVGLAVATRGRSVPEQIAAGTAVGTAQGVGSAVSEVRDYLGGMTDADLYGMSPVFRKMVDEGAEPVDARAMLTKQAEDTAAKYVAPVSAVGGAATGALLGKAGGHALEHAAKGGIARTIVGAVLGFTEEGIQEVGEGVAQRKGINDATGDTRDLGDGSFGEFALGGLGGAGMGGAKGAATRGVHKAPAIDATKVIDAETQPQTLALPAPVVRVDSDGNARMDGVTVPVIDEPAARVSGRSSDVRAAVREELAALGYEPTKRASATPITVDERGNAVTDDQTPVRDRSIEPQARTVGRAEVIRDELGALGYEPSAPRAQATPIRVDGQGNATTDEQTQPAQTRDDSLGDLPRTSGRAPVDVPEQQATAGLGYDGTNRANPSPISVDSQGDARLHGETRSGDQIATERLEAEAAKLFPKKADAEKRAEWVDAQRQREMGYEARMRSLAEKANAKRAKRVAASEPAVPSRPDRDLRPTGELGVVSRSNADGSTSYFFATQPDEALTVGKGTPDGGRPISSITGNTAAHSALLRAALVDGPISAGPKTIGRDALKAVPGATVDRYGVTRMVGRDADKSRMSAELNRMAAKAASDRADKLLEGDDRDLATAAIAADPRKAASVLRKADVEAVRAGLREIVPGFVGESQDVPVSPEEVEQRTSERLKSQGVGVDQDFVDHITEAGRDAVKAGHMTRDEFFAATRAARDGNREAAIAALRKSDERRGVESQASLAGKPSTDLDTDAKVSLEEAAPDESKMGHPDFMGDPMERRYVPLWGSAKGALAKALRDIEAMGVPREWLSGIQGYFVTLGNEHGVMAFFSKASNKPVRGIGLTEDSIPTDMATAQDHRLFRGRLIHELAHAADHDGTAPRSASDPRLAVDGSTGDVAQEIIDLYGKGEGALAELFSYPLDGWFEGRYSGPTTSSELHAQIVRAYFTNRAELERQAPKAYDYATRFVEEPGAGREGTAGAYRPVQQAVRGEPDRGPGFDATRPLDGARQAGPGERGDSGATARRDGLRDERAGGLSNDRPERTGDRGGSDRGRGAAAQEAQGEVRRSPLPGYAHGQIVGAAGPDPRINAVAEQYARDHGIDAPRQSRYTEVDLDRARRLAAEYEAMVHAPQDAKVREAYENLIRQTTDQYRALEAAGYQFWFMDPDADPYKGNPWNAMRDLRASQSMAVFPTTAGFGTSEDFDGEGNPLMVDTGIKWPYGSLDGQLKPVLANDLFRAVHDAFGHGLEGAGFRAQGEENAWQAHARLFTGSALAALTSETRGQNSWLNFGPHAEGNQTAKVEDTVFADQKTGLMPDWTWSEGFDDGTEAQGIDKGVLTLTKAQKAVSLEQDLYSGKLELIGEKFRTQADLGRFLNERAQRALGRNLVGDYSKESRDFVAGVFAREGVLAMEQSGNAAEWYRDSINGAMKNAARLHPEIGTDPNHRFMFSVALAVTSNGSAMDANTRLGFEGYEHWKVLGKLPLRLTGAGERGSAMIEAFKNVNKMIEVAGNVDTVREFMLTKWPVREIKSKMATLGIKVSSAELADSMVYGGYVLGPKIGAAFLPNMNGKHDALTADRWFSRTFNRVIGGMLDNNGATVDTPRNGAERQFMRDVIARAVATLGRRGYHMEPADLQALLWYPEKELYAFHGVSDKRAAPTDYEQETRKYVEARLQQKESGRSPAGTESGRGRRDGDRQGDPAAAERQVALFGEEEPAVRRSEKGRVANELASLAGLPRRSDEAQAPAGKPDAADHGGDEARVSPLADALEADAGEPVRVRPVAVSEGSARGKFAAAMKKLFGVETVYFTSDDPNAPAGGAYVPGDSQTIYIHARGDVDPVATFGHEFTHALKDAHNDLWTSLMTALRRVSKDTLANRADQEASYGRAVSDSLVEEENLSDVAAAAFGQDAFWEEFHSELDASAMKRFFRWASRWVGRMFERKVDLSGAEGFAQAASAMRSDLARAYAEAARRNPTVRSLAADMELGVRRSSRTNQHGIEPDAGSPLGRTAARAGATVIKTATPVTAAAQVANKVVDTIGEQLARVTGVKALGNKAVSLAERAIDAKTSWGWLEKAKQGLIADYGLPEEYLDAKLSKQVRENKLMREAKGTLDRLSAMTPDQLAVAYQWLQEKPDTAEERTLLAKLPADQQAAMQQMKTDIDNLSKEAVKLGLITQETYDRNKMAYVHRSYKKYEAELTGSQAVARQRAQRLKGDQFKGRGMELEASLDRVRGELPENLKGMKLEMLEKRDAAGKLVRREYLVQGTKRPAALADYTSAGIWEVRDATKKGDIKVWRDFTQAERQRMGEIEDARYGFARTMVQGIRDVETSRFLRWTAINYGKDSEEGLDVAEISGVHAALGSQTFTRDQWVKVPETKIKGTSIARYGDLAGKYVPAVMYSDLAGVMELRNNLWDVMLGAWKTSKTALSPAVHVNNVMSNFIMADLAEVGVNDIRRALETIVQAKAGNPSAKALIERYDDSGAESGSFAANEIKTSVIEPLLKQIADTEPESVQKASLANVIALAAHGQLREAGVALTKTLPGRATGATVEAMIKAYQSEDAVFRLAKFMNEINAGKTDAQAGKAARDAFLNYDINAPWVRAARRSVLPFISFTYRAVPLLAKAVATKPWKFAKYAALGEALSMLAYMALGGGGDEEKEKRLLPDDVQGRSLGIPKMMRLPWNNKHGDPMWLDVRRWLPAGDFTETSGSKSSIPLPQWLSIGGPLSLLIDFYSNTDWRGEKMVKATDTPSETMMKVTDMAAKFMLPNLPAPGVGWLMRKMGAPVDTGMLDPYGWTGIERGLNGSKDGFGNEVDPGVATARSLGVKVEVRPLQAELARIGLDAKAKEKEIETGARTIGRKMGRGEITREEGERRIAREVEKLKELGKKTREKVTPSEH